MGRHDLGRIGGGDPQEGFRLFGLTGDERVGVGVFLQGGEGTGRVVHAEVGLTLVGIRPMAGEAFVGEDGADVEVVADGIGEIVGGQYVARRPAPKAVEQEKEDC